MIPEQKQKGIRAEPAYTKLHVPHLDGELTFIHPYKGPGTYAELANQLDKDNLGRPTASQNSSLIHSAWATYKENPQEQYSKEIISLLKLSFLKSNWLACFTGNHYVQNEGVYIQDTPEIKNSLLSMEKSDLVKKLEVNDPSVRFVPFGYKIGVQSALELERSALELERNPYVIGLVGEEGAQKLAEISGNYKFVPYVFGFDKIDQTTIRLSALGASWGLGSSVLGVNGDFDYYIEGRVFGVFRKTAEGSSQNF